MERSETRLEWIQCIGLIHERLQLVGHHPLDNLAKEGNIGDGPIIANVVRRQGTWLLSSWGSREMSNGMRLRFRDAKCDKDYEEDNEDDGGHAAYVNIVRFTPEKAMLSKDRVKEHRGAVVDDSQELGENELNGVNDEDDEEQRILASQLGLRTFNGSVAEEEELNLTAIAIQEDRYTIRSVSDGDGTFNEDSSGNSQLGLADNNDALPGDKLQEVQSTTLYPTSLESFLPNTSLAGETSSSDTTGAVSTLSSEQSQDDHEDNATQISGIYTQTREPEHLSTGEIVQSKDGVESLLRTDAPFLEKEDNEAGRDPSERRRERQIMSEATLFALKEMCALLLHVQQKENLSALDNTTSKAPFLAIPTEEDAPGLYRAETGDFLYDYEDDKDEEMRESSRLSTKVPRAVEKTVEFNGSDPQHASELVFSGAEKNGNWTSDGELGSVIYPAIPQAVNQSNLLRSMTSSSGTVITQAVENVTGPPRQRPKCPPKKTVYEWNAIAEKNDEMPADLTKDAPSGWRNRSPNATTHLRNTTLSSKRNLELYKNDSPLERGQPELSQKHEALNENRNENCTIKSSGTFVKARRKTKPSRVLTPRTSKPLMTPRGFNTNAAAAEGKDTVLLNETNDAHLQNQAKPIVTIGLPVENGDYQEYVLGDDIDDEDSSSDSYEFQTVYYDNPYTTDSRLDINTVRNPDDIAGRYLRALNKGGNVRRYYIAAEEVFWEYATLRKRFDGIISL